MTAPCSARDDPLETTGFAKASLLLRRGHRWVRGVELVPDAPAIYVLADALALELMPRRYLLLRPFEHAFERDAVPPSDDDVPDLSVLDRAPNGLRRDAEELRGIGDGHPNHGLRGLHGHITPWSR